MEEEGKETVGTKENNVGEEDHPAQKERSENKVERKEKSDRE